MYNLVYLKISPRAIEQVFIPYDRISKTLKYNMSMYDVKALFTKKRIIKL